MSAGTRRVPLGDSATANEFAQRKFTGGTLADTTAHVTTELVEYSWSGKYITMRAIGADVHFAFTRFPTAEVDRAVAATEAGATTKVGGLLLAGEERDFQLPQFDVTRKLYFSRESSAINAVVLMGLSDDKQVLT